MTPEEAIKVVCLIWDAKCNVGGAPERALMEAIALFPEMDAPAEKMFDTQIAPTVGYTWQQYKKDYYQARNNTPLDSLIACMTPPPLEEM
jgi:hypothetical protein